MNYTSLKKALVFGSQAVLANPLDIKKIQLFKDIYPYTMVGYARVANVYDVAQDIISQGIQGALVECGVWRGGLVGIMATLAQKEAKGRRTWLFDSFEGLPEPTELDGVKAKSYASSKSEGKLASIQQCVGTLEDVSRLLFDILKLDKKNIIFKKGWFQNTLPLEKGIIGSIALLRLDGDWYESTKCCLENLYDNVVKGGYIIIDDYGCWEGCRKAVDEFLQQRQIKVEIIPIDKDGVYFKKP